MHIHFYFFKSAHIHPNTRSGTHAPTRERANDDERVGEANLEAIDLRFHEDDLSSVARMERKGKGSFNPFSPTILISPNVLSSSQCGGSRLFYSLFRIQSTLSVMIYDIRLLSPSLPRNTQCQPQLVMWPYAAICLVCIVSSHRILHSTTDRPWETETHHKSSCKSRIIDMIMDEEVIKFAIEYGPQTTFDNQ